MSIISGHALAEENEGQSGFLRPRCSTSDVRMQNDSEPLSPMDRLVIELDFYQILKRVAQ